MAQRQATVTRETGETQVRIVLNLDGAGAYSVGTGVGFFDHMLSQIARHGLLDLEIEARGDLDVDAHHVVEDVGLAFGSALAEAVGDKAGLRRYGWAAMPMDEALVVAAVDFSGRPYLQYGLSVPIIKLGAFDSQLTREFFQAVANAAAVTIHLHQVAGYNAHHIIEAAFKGFGCALDQATSIDPRRSGQVPSTKGVL